MRPPIIEIVRFKKNKKNFKILLEDFIIMV